MSSDIHFPLSRQRSHVNDALSFKIQVQKALLAEDQEKFSDRVSSRRSTSSLRSNSSDGFIADLAEPSHTPDSAEHVTPSGSRIFTSEHKRFAIWRDAIELALQFDDYTSFTKLFAETTAKPTASSSTPSDATSDVFQLNLQDYLDEQTFLHRAASHAALDICCGLIEEHKFSPRTQNRLGELPLHRFLSSPYLLKRSFSPDSLSRFLTILTFSGSRRVTECLDSQDLTPFHVAATCISLPVVRKLIQCCGSNLSSVLKQTDPQGRTPFVRGLAIGICPEVVFEIGSATLQKPLQSLDDASFLYFYATAFKSQNHLIVDSLYRLRCAGQPLITAFDNSLTLVGVNDASAVELLFDYKFHGFSGIVDLETFFNVTLPILSPSSHFFSLLIATTAKKLKFSITHRGFIRKRLSSILLQWLETAGGDLHHHLMSLISTQATSILKPSQLEPIMIRPSHRIPSLSPDQTNMEDRPFRLADIFNHAPPAINRHLTILCRSYLEAIQPEALLRYFVTQEGLYFLGDVSYTQQIRDFFELGDRIRIWVFTTILSAATPILFSKFIQQFSQTATQAYQTGNYFCFYIISHALKDPLIVSVMDTFQEVDISPEFEQDYEGMINLTKRMTTFDEYRRVRLSVQPNLESRSFVPIFSFIFDELRRILGSSDLYLFRADASNAGAVVNFSLSVRIFSLLQTELINLKSNIQSSFNFDPDTMFFIRRATSALNITLQLGEPGLADLSEKSKIMIRTYQPPTTPESSTLPSSPFAMTLNYDPQPPTPFQREIHYAFKALMAWRNQLRSGFTLDLMLKPVAFFMEKISATWPTSGTGSKVIQWANVFHSNFLTTRKLLPPQDFGLLSRLFNKVYQQLRTYTPPLATDLVCYCSRCLEVCQCPSSPTKKSFSLDLLKSLVEYCNTHTVDPQSSLIGLIASAKTLGFLHISSSNAKVCDEIKLDQEQLCDLILLWNKLGNADTLRQQVSDFAEVIMQSRRKWDVGAIVVVNPTPTEPSSPFFFARIISLLEKDVIVNIDPLEGNRGILRFERLSCIPISSSLVELVNLGVSSEIKKLTHTSLDIFRKQLVQDRDTILRGFFSSCGINLSPAIQDLILTVGNQPLSLVHYNEIKKLQASLQTLERSLDTSSVSQTLSEIDQLLFSKAMDHRPDPKNIFLPSLYEDTQSLQQMLSQKFALDGARSFIKKVYSLFQKVKESHENILKGVVKSQLTGWWHKTIKKKVYEFLFSHGYQLGVIPYNYTDERPQDINAVHAQALLFNDVLDPKTDIYGFRSFVESVVKTIHVRIAEFLNEVKLAISLVVNIPPEQFSSSLIEQWLQAKDQHDVSADLIQAVKDIHDDYVYLCEMKSMDDEWLLNKNTASGPLRLTQVVPISGLIISVVVRLSTEVSTVLELWS